VNDRCAQKGNAASSRRGFLMTATLTGAALAGGRALGQVESDTDRKTAPPSGKLKIEVAGYKYDRVEGLADGRVKIEGCESQFVGSKISDMNTHVFNGPRTRQVTEIGLMPFILAFANEGFRDYSLIPVFPFRTFRHKSIFIRTDRGIKGPKDLRGRKVATPGYSQTSLTWIRGILEHEYGVKPNEIQWIISAQDSTAKGAGNASEFEKVLPRDLSIQMGPEGKDESDMLVDGDVDALFHALEPRAYQEGHPKVARLFTDSRKVEQAYFAKTGIFPIMHSVAIRNDVIDAHPWLPKAVFDAYSESKKLAYDFLKNHAWAMTALPWVTQEGEETRRLMGDNYWPYGITPNHKTLESLFQYAHEQGLAKRRLTVEDIFHPSAMLLEEEPA
jgi:4,5-dihydroxyphthalate decarboxylase